MEIKTKVISIETIKPSSPTPKSLQKHRLSIIDQSMPPIYIPFVYLYESNPKIPNSQKSKQLKTSLSEVLSRFYPLAGHHLGNVYVDCNDSCAPFLEAEADCDLSQAMPHANYNVLDKLLPYKMHELQDFCMAVQATFFRCGGLALGILISHKIADGISYNLFVNTWSDVTRNGDFGGMPLPEFNTAAYFPPLQDPSALNPSTSTEKEEVAFKIFTFPAAAISHLRELYSGGSVRPSRTEALSACIWTQFVSATCTRSDPNKIFLLNHVVDLRSRADPPLSKYCFGNVIGVSTAMPADGDGGVEVVRKIREALKAINGYVAHQNESESDEKQSIEMVRKMREALKALNGYVEHRNDSESDEKQSIEMVAVPFSFSSLCGFPFYEADFGWGRPVWVGLNQFPNKDSVFFMDTKSGGGIEAFIHLAKQDMEKFEAHLNLPMLKSNL